MRELRRSWTLGATRDGRGRKPRPATVGRCLQRSPIICARNDNNDNHSTGEGMTVAGIPLDFILFALTLLGVALFHHHTLAVALTGLAAIAVFKLAFGDFSG